LGYGKAVEDVAIPDPLAFAGANQPSFDTCADQEFGKSLN
jgi:hypothetical protein